MPESTQWVVEHHVRAFGEGLEPVMEDCTDESVLITNDDTYCGLDQIREFFRMMIENLPEGFEEAVVIRRKEVQGEVAFLLWDAKTLVSILRGYAGRSQWQDFVSHIRHTSLIMSEKKGGGTT